MDRRDRANYLDAELDAIIAFMFWIWLSIIVVLIGAELNAETEHQTVRDTTTGRPKPMGGRGATMADTIGARQALLKYKAPERVPSDSGLPEMVKIDAEGFDLKVIGRIVTAWQSASLDSKKLFS
jgi:hypothetical protein